MTRSLLFKEVKHDRSRTVVGIQRSHLHALHYRWHIGRERNHPLRVNTFVVDQQCRGHLGRVDEAWPAVAWIQTDGVV